MIETLSVNVSGQGLHDITKSVSDLVSSMTSSNDREGLCTLFIQHTSASLLIQENYDPAVCHDLEAWLKRLVPEDEALYTHTQEGPDDMPAHIKSALTAVSLSIPILDSQLALGTWQGIFLWEHRHHRGKRKIVVHLV
ncbi:MAG: secondary thiamine-phosphate synthase enzyme YjbQ [Gammaproteobacteria bacterium]|nr:secondary thiamine-phosphate synthase enzyme YjbQ [Gammaproteobacteria bacterium]